jgi:ATP-dependent protease HslVU (ClpYQ) peptidase subunit
VTCIVGIEHGGKVLIGGDSAGTGGYHQTIRADEKVFLNGEFAFGFTSSFRMGQLLRYKLTVPDFVENADLDTHMVTSFVDAVRTTLKQGGFAQNDRGEECGGTFLVGVRGRLYTIYDDYQVARSVDGYAAVGCGDQLALGALYATSQLRPKARATRALEAAAKFSSGVAGPFNFAETS